MEFILAHTEYLLMLGVCILGVVKTIHLIVKEDEPSSDEEDGDGGIEESMDLDLPPGVALPQDKAPVTEDVAVNA